MRTQETRTDWQIAFGSGFLTREDSGFHSFGQRLGRETQKSSAKTNQPWKINLKLRNLGAMFAKNGPRRSWATSKG